MTDGEGKFLEASLHGHPYVRFHFIDENGRDALVAAAESYDYVFAYSFVDLGDIEGFSRETKASQLLTLDGTAEDLMNQFHKKVRQQVRRAERDEGVHVEVDDPAREESYQFYVSIKQESGVTPHVEQDFSSVLWINGYLDGELVASSSWFDSGTTLRCQHSMSIRKDDGADRALLSRLNRLLMWEACRLAEKTGRRYVDLAGIDLDDPTKAGIAEFKLGFGGETVPVQVYRYMAPEWDEVLSQIRSDGQEIL